MAVTENQLIHREDGNKGGGPVGANAVIYIGTLVYVDATNGDMVATTNSGGNKFAGVSLEHKNNTGGASGDLHVNLWERSSLVLRGAGFTQADVGKKAYGSDNFTVTTTSTSNTYIGTITRVLSATEVLVALDVQLP